MAFAGTFKRGVPELPGDPALPPADLNENPDRHVRPSVD